MKCPIFTETRSLLGNWNRGTKSAPTTTAQLLNNAYNTHYVAIKTKQINNTMPRKSSSTFIDFITLFVVTFAVDLGWCLAWFLSGYLVPQEVSPLRRILELFLFLFFILSSLFWLIKSRVVENRNRVMSSERHACSLQQRQWHYTLCCLGRTLACLQFHLEASQSCF